MTDSLHQQQQQQQQQPMTSLLLGPTRSNASLTPRRMKNSIIHGVID